MILADTSVWIDFLRYKQSPQVAELTQAVVDGEVVMGDLILVEILQGVRTPEQESAALEAFSKSRLVTLCGPELAPIAASNYRRLRRAGITARTTIDVIIATWCVENGASLIHSDRDFDMMQDLIGFRTGIKRSMN
jgi:predicted nucleic acid-binding protein